MAIVLCLIEPRWLNDTPAIIAEGFRWVWLEKLEEWTLECNGCGRQYYNHITTVAMLLHLIRECAKVVVSKEAPKANPPNPWAL